MKDYNGNMNLEDKIEHPLNNWKNVVKYAVPIYGDVKYLIDMERYFKEDWINGRILYSRMGCTGAGEWRGDNGGYRCISFRETIILYVVWNCSRYIETADKGIYW